ncbi:MAG: hypothetical protein ABEJ02_04625 [Candidatus Paceibacteria bacterium]
MKRKISATIIFTCGLLLLGASCDLDRDKNKQAKQKLKQTQNKMAQITSTEFSIISNLKDNADVKKLKLNGQLKFDTQSGFQSQYKISSGHSPEVEFLHYETDKIVRLHKNKKTKVWQQKSDTSTDKITTKQAVKIRKLIRSSELFDLKKFYDQETKQQFKVQINPAELQLLLRKINLVNKEAFDKSKMIQLYRSWKNKTIKLWREKNNGYITKIKGNNLPLHTLFPIKKIKTGTTTIRLSNYNNKFQLPKPDISEESSLKSPKQKQAPLSGLLRTKNTRQNKHTDKRKIKKQVENKVDQKLEQSGINSKEVRKKLEDFY